MARPKRNPIASDIELSRFPSDVSITRFEVFEIHLGHEIHLRARGPGRGLAGIENTGPAFRQIR